MNNTLTLPDSIHLGAGTLSQLPELLKPLGHKVLLVHGHRPVEDGLLVKVRKLLFDAGFEFANMGQILPNPKYGSVKRGIKIARAEGCDIILSLGGGSTLQCAKAIALGLNYKGDVWDFWTGKKKPQNVCPIASILTNPSSGSELSDGCTIVKGDKRKTVHYEQLKSSLSILDPELSLYPRYPTMNQVFLVFIRIFFAWLSIDDERKPAAEDLMKQILDCGSALEANINDIPARTALYRIFLETYLSLPKPVDNLAALGDDLGFSASMPAGSGVSALFFAWLSLQDQSVRDTVESLKTPLGFENDSCPTVVESLEKRFLAMGLPLDLPQAGLRLTQKQIATIASSAQDEKILTLANTGYANLHLPTHAAAACQAQKADAPVDSSSQPAAPKTDDGQKKAAAPDRKASECPKNKKHKHKHANEDHEAGLKQSAPSEAGKESPADLPAHAHKHKHSHKHAMKHARMQVEDESSDPAHPQTLMQPYSRNSASENDLSEHGHHHHHHHHH